MKKGNTVAKRSDFDYMYLNKGQFEVRFMEQTLHAVHDAKGCASIEVAISNTTELPITIIWGTLIIRNMQEVELSRHRLYGLETYVGADFKLTLLPKSEVVGHLLVGFDSSDPFRLNIDEHGISDDMYDFELLLMDARDKKYFVKISQASVFVNGDFLWKVKEAKGIKHKFRNRE